MNTKNFEGVAKAILDKDILAQSYENGDSMSAIARKYGVSQTLTRRLLRECGVKIKPAKEFRKYSLSKDYFKKIDSHEKAQILGFIAADGCVYRSKRQNSLYLSIAINQIDEEYLNSIRIALGYNGPLRVIKKQNGSYHVALSVCDSELANDLIALGCEERKSLTIKFPTLNQVPEEFISSFVLGYFEGDGSIYNRQYSNTHSLYTHLAFCGTKEFLESMNMVFEKLANSKGIIYPHGPIFEMKIHKREYVKNILEFMYKNATFTMSRKKTRSCNFLESLLITA